MPAAVLATWRTNAGSFQLKTILAPVVVNCSGIGAAALSDKGVRPVNIAGGVGPALIPPRHGLPVCTENTAD